MKTLTLSSVSALLVAGAFASTAQAQQPMSMQPYLGGDALFWELDPEGRGGDFDSTGLRLRGGVAFNDYFAIEGHLGTGGSDGPVNLDYLAGGYVKGMLPITHAFKVYGLLGGTEVELDRTDSESDVSYGAGASYDMTPNLAVGADYMRYLDTSDFDFDAASVGLTYRF